MEFSVWCDQCDAWIDNFGTDDDCNPEITWITCDFCGNGLVKVQKRHHIIDAIREKSMEFSVWCDQCDAWIDNFGTEITWITCDFCGNGLVKVLREK